MWLMWIEFNYNRNHTRFGFMVRCLLLLLLIYFDLHGNEQLNAICVVAHYLNTEFIWYETTWAKWLTSRLIPIHIMPCHSTRAHANIETHTHRQRCRMSEPMRTFERLNQPRIHLPFSLNERENQRDRTKQTTHKQLKQKSYEFRFVRIYLHRSQTFQFLVIFAVVMVCRCRHSLCTSNAVFTFNIPM